MIHVLFPLGVRLSTILTALAFMGLAAARRDRLALIAGWLWLTTFEAVFQIASLALDRLPRGPIGPVFFLTLAAVTLYLTRGKVQPDRRFLAAALVFVAVWMATGFHLNGHEDGMLSFHARLPDFDGAAEFLNESAKTLWALAYFLPLVRGHGAGAPARAAGSVQPPRRSRLPRTRTYANSNTTKRAARMMYRIIGPPKRDERSIS